MTIRTATGAREPTVEPRIATRLHVDDTLAEGGQLVLGADRAHFLVHVLRLKPGAALAVFNARDGEFLARIVAATKSGVSLALGARRRAPQAEGDLWLLFAPIKRGRIDFLAEKASELGAALLWPVFTRNTAVERVNIARLRANAVEAAEQCERLSVPDVREAAMLEQAIGAWPPGRRLYVCAERVAVPSAAESFARHPAGAGAAILTGPEGGFAPGELDDLGKLPFVTAVGLGPRVLRADTAALAALALWQAVAGDWREASKP